MSNGISLKGIVAPDSTVHKFDYDYLDSKPLIPEVDADLDTEGDAADAKAAGDLAKNLVAPAYSASATYNVGDQVTYNGKLYRCTTAIATAEAWTAGHWTVDTVAEELGDVRESVGDLKNYYEGTTERKNILPAKTTSITYGAVTSTYNNGAYSCGGTATSDGGRTRSLLAFNLPAGTYTISAQNIEYTGTQPAIYLQKSSDDSIVATIYSGATDDPVTFALAEETRVYLGTNVVNTKTYNFNCNLQLETGSDATEYISPFGSAIDLNSRKQIEGIHEVMENSKNLLPVESQTKTVNSVVASYGDGVLTLNGTASANGGRLNAIIGPLTLPAGTYILSFSDKKAIAFFVETGSSVIVQSTDMATVTFTLNSETSIYIGLNTVDGKVYDEEFGVQIEAGSTKTNFHPPSFITAIDHIARNEIPEWFVTDNTLTKQNVPADGLETGEQIRAIRSDIDDFFQSEVREIVEEWLEEHPDMASNVVFPESFGAVGDGVSADGDAVQAALNTGKTVVGFGTYNLSRETPYSEVGLIGIPSGAHIIGCKFKFPNSLQSMNSMFRGSSFVMEKCEFDMNGSNNIPLNNNPMYCFNIRICNGITIRDCHFKNSAGRNYIIVQEGSHFTLENCTFKNGGTNLEGSNAGLQNDFSYVYTDAEYSVIDKCIILEPDNDPFTYCGGYELHGNHSMITNSVANKCLPAIYIGEHHFDEATPIVDMKILNNRALNCQIGISFFNNLDLDSVQVIGNQITLKPVVASVQNRMQGITSGENNVVDGLILENNVIEEAAASLYGSAGIALSGVSNMHILKNRFANMTYPIRFNAGSTFKNMFVRENIAVSDEVSTEYMITIASGVTVPETYIGNNIFENYAGLIQ